MVLEVYIWSWIHLHPRSIAKQLLKFLGISILIPGLTIDLSASSTPGDLALDVD